jgi:hypothetical protein
MSFNVDRHLNWTALFLCMEDKFYFVLCFVFTAQSPDPCNCNPNFSKCLMVVNKKTGHTSCSTVCDRRRLWHGISSGYYFNFHFYVICSTIYHWIVNIVGTLMSWILKHQTCCSIFFILMLKVYIIIYC